MLYLYDDPLHLEEVYREGIKKSFIGNEILSTFEKNLDPFFPTNTSKPKNPTTFTFNYLPYPNTVLRYHLESIFKRRIQVIHYKIREWGGWVDIIVSSPRVLHMFQYQEGARRVEENFGSLERSLIFPTGVEVWMDGKMEGDKAFFKDSKSGYTWAILEVYNM